MPAEPNCNAEKHHQGRQANDIQCFDKCFCSRFGIIERVEALLFATHNGNAFAVIEVINDIQDVSRVGPPATGIHHIVFQHIG